MGRSESGAAHYNRTFLKILRDALEEVFGRQAAGVLLKHIEQYYNLKWEETPENPEVFAEALNKVLGESSSVLENVIIQRLRAELNLKEGKSFTDIRKMRKDFIKSQQKLRQERSRSP